MKLGQGGYDVVYGGTILGEHGRSVEVAVKQFSGADTKGREDFLAELSIIDYIAIVSHEDGLVVSWIFLHELRYVPSDLHGGGGHACHTAAAPSLTQGCLRGEVLGRMAKMRRRCGRGRSVSRTMFI